MSSEVFLSTSAHVDVAGAEAPVWEGREMVSIIDSEFAGRKKEKGGKRRWEMQGGGAGESLLLLAGTTWIMRDLRYRLKKKKKRRLQGLRWIGCRLKRRWMIIGAPGKAALAPDPAAPDAAVAGAGVSVVAAASSQ